MISLFCKHDWEVLVKETMPAPIDKLRSAEGEARLPHWTFKNKKIIICVCRKCGKLDKTIVENP